MTPDLTPREPPGGGCRPGGLAGLTFALPAFPLVARLAEAPVGLGRVLADGVDVAFVRALRALVHVDIPCWGRETLVVRCGREAGGAEERDAPPASGPTLVLGLMNSNSCAVTI